MNRTHRPRTIVAGLIMIALAGMGPQPSLAGGSVHQQLIDTACSLPRQALERVWRGSRVDRSGDIQLVPLPDSFVDGGLGHASPWPYTQEVPVFWYGPGHIPELGAVKDPVTSADIAPTEAGVLGFDGFHAPDGKPMQQVLTGNQGDPPKLLVTLVWDSAGTDVLRAWAHEWPYLKSLIPDGVWYEHATVGSSPSNTPPIHATIGTGAFPYHHGMLDDYIRNANQIQKPNENGPSFLMEPTLADIYDLAMRNQPVVGGIATLAAHQSFLGHGSMWGGGDRDIAITREKTDAVTAGAEGVSWGLTNAMAPFFTLPNYANHLPPLSDYWKPVDRMDGKVDGKWYDRAIKDMNGGFDTPARTPYQTTLIETIVKKEGFGQDDVPDILQINYKAIDTIGHLFSANGLQMRDAVATQDEALKILVNFLNRQVGKGDWAMVLTADHGTQLDPEKSGFWQIGIDQLTADIEQKFDDSDNTPLIERVRPTQIWFDDQELKDNGYNLDQVSAFVLGLTQSETIKPAVGAVQPGKGNAKVFDAVFPTTMLNELPCIPEAQG